MPRGRQLAPLAVGDADCAQLRGFGKSITVPHALVLCARMILAGGEGITKAAVADRGLGQGGRKATRAISQRGTPRLHDEYRLDRAEACQGENAPRGDQASLASHVCQRRPLDTGSTGAVEGRAAYGVSRWLRPSGVKPHLAVSPGRPRRIHPW